MLEPEKPGDDDPTRGIARPLKEQKPGGDADPEQEEATPKDIPAKE